MKTDFLGREYGVGDKIVYAARSGSSLYMTLAEVIGFTEAGNPRVQPLESNGPRGYYKYTDTRTGEEIERPFLEGAHWLSGGRWTNPLTGETLLREEAWEFPWTERRNFVWTPIEFQPWVKKEQIFKVVILPVAENVVLVEKKRGD